LRAQWSRNALPVLALLALAAAIVIGTPLGERARATLQGVGVEDRLSIFTSATEAFVDRPILGYGPDGFRVAYPRFRDAASLPYFGLGVTQSSAHSWLFQAAATTGTVGLAALVLFIAITVTYLWRGLRVSPTLAGPLLFAVIAYWSHGLVTVGTIGVDWIPWVVAGGCCHLHTASESPRAIRRLTRLAVVAVGILAIVAAGSQFFALSANRAGGDANDAWHAGAATRAIRASESAVRLDSRRAHYWNLLGLGYELAARWRDAADAYAQAARRAPYEANYWGNLAHSLAELAVVGDASRGGAEAALEAARRAHDTDPNDPNQNVRLAEVANLFGQYDEALEAATRAIRLFPQAIRNADLAAEAARGATDLPRARLLLDDALRVVETAPLRAAFADVLLRLGDAVSARAQASRALLLDPQNGEARRILALTDR
jgi:cytochrome c-type biogenesis protein CcmH/NrfG